MVDIEITLSGPPPSESDGGFSLLEVMIAAAVLGIGVMAAITGMHTFSQASEKSKQKNIAYFDMHTVAERIAGIEFEEITNPYTGSGALKSAVGLPAPEFPEGQPIVGFDNLDNEEIIVTYFDSAGTRVRFYHPPGAGDPVALTVGNLSHGLTTPSPLHCRIVVSWDDNRGMRITETMSVIRAR